MSVPSRYRVCVVGLGSMGMGAALSCLRAGLSTCGIDLDAGRRDAFKAQGAEGVADGVAGLGGDFDAVIVLVVNGAQARQVILGQEAWPTASHPAARSWSAAPNRRMMRAPWALIWPRAAS